MYNDDNWLRQFGRSFDRMVLTVVGIGVVIAIVVHIGWHASIVGFLILLALYTWRARWVEQRDAQADLNEAADRWMAERRRRDAAYREEHPEQYWA